MTLVQLSDVTFGYPGTDLFEGISWRIGAGSRIGLVGPNGAGKSTLLRLLAGETQPDTGQVVRTRGTRVGYLRQSQEFHEGQTLIDELLAPFAEVLAIHAELHAAEQALAKDSSPAALERYAHLAERYTHADGYSLESRVRMLATEVGFGEADFDRDVGTLSGGERGRLELAKVLASEPELLLLDEPTNHLDLAATMKLETRLRDYPPGKSFVLVSHDRALLETACSTIVDVGGLAPGQLDFYVMRYHAYTEERELRRERALAEFTRQREEIARQEDFIRRNIAGQKTNQAKSRRKMLAKLDRLERPEDTWGAAARIGLRFTLDAAGPKEVVRARSLSVGYPGASLLEALDLIVYRGDRIGIIGPNGAGKTTLLKTLVGRQAQLAGEAELNAGVTLGFYDQKHRDLEEERSLVEEIQTVRPTWTPDPIRNYLARFRFFGDDVFRKVKGLSGGERSRLALGKMMLIPRNLLAFDEPTNHLDIPAREVLEAALSGYEGTLLIVSHDRYFLDRVASKILVLEEGRAELHIGSYSEVHERRARRLPDPEPEPKPKPKKEPTPPQAPPARTGSAHEFEASRQARRKREQATRRLAALESEIAELETKHSAIKERLGSDPGGEWASLHALVEEEQQLEARLGRLLSEWETLGRTLDTESK